jgi:hypothetical protein
MLEPPCCRGLRGCADFAPSELLLGVPIERRKSACRRPLAELLGD